MARSPCTFRQRDAEALVRAVRKGGCEVARVEVDRDGKIVVITGMSSAADASQNPWDEVLIREPN
jgi:hypothetical protein